MFTNFMLIQKIDEEGRLEQLLSEQGQFIWRFLEREQVKSDKASIYPFEVDQNINFRKVPKGRETKVVANTKNKTLIFEENYAVPSGFVIGVLIPPKYIPISISFGKKCLMPIGQAFPSPPGYVDILYNKQARQCAVVLSIFNQSSFQLRCVCGLCNTDFPSALHNYNGTALSASILASNIGKNAITENDLKVFSQYFVKDLNLSQMAKDINELKDWALEDRLDSTKEKTATSKIIGALSSSISVGGTLTTLIDSYMNGGAIAKVISAILLSI